MSGAFIQAHSFFHLWHSFQGLGVVKTYLIDCRSDRTRSCFSCFPPWSRYWIYWYREIELGDIVRQPGPISYRFLGWSLLAISFRTSYKGRKRFHYRWWEKIGTTMFRLAGESTLLVYIYVQMLEMLVNETALPRHQVLHPVLHMPIMKKKLFPSSSLQTHHMSSVRGPTWAKHCFGSKSNTRWATGSFFFLFLANSLKETFCMYSWTMTVKPLWVPV